MKLKKIVANDIKKCHPNQNSYQTDQYYQQLANRLQDRFCSLGKMSGEHIAEVIHCASIMLANQSVHGTLRLSRTIVPRGRRVLP